MVLATGGYAQIYLNTNNVPGITGDGQAPAFDLGIPLKDMEGLSVEAARPLNILPSRWWKGQKVFKVAPTTPFCMGGIVTNQFGETTVKGLFAAGETTPLSLELVKMDD